MNVTFDLTCSSTRTSVVLSLTLSCFIVGIVRAFLVHDLLLAHNACSRYFMWKPITNGCASREMKSSGKILSCVWRHQDAMQKSCARSHRHQITHRYQQTPAAVKPRTPIPKEKYVSMIFQWLVSTTTSLRILHHETKTQSGTCRLKSFLEIFGRFIVAVECTLQVAKWSKTCSKNREGLLISISMTYGSLDLCVESWTWVTTISW